MVVVGSWWLWCLGCGFGVCGILGFVGLLSLWFVVCFSILWLCDYLVIWSLAVVLFLASGVFVVVCMVAGLGVLGGWF